MIRNERGLLHEVTWTDDIQVEWASPEGIGMVQAALDYKNADARIILRRGPNESILASGLGTKMSYAGRHTFEEGDVVVLQWRALTPSETAISEVAELTIEEVEDQFE